jgi:peptidoglycan hydrolase CwlO-like protein
VFSPTDLREFHLREWVSNTQLRSDIEERLEQVLYRILKGQNSAYNNATQPENEPQENVKDLAARLEALQQDVQDIKEQLGLPPG